MRNPEDLSLDELQDIVREFQYALSTRIKGLDANGDEIRVWACDETVSESGLVDLAYEVLGDADLLSSDAQDGQVVHRVPDRARAERPDYNMLKCKCGNDRLWREYSLIKAEQSVTLFGGGEGPTYGEMAFIDSDPSIPQSVRCRECYGLVWQNTKEVQS